MNCPGCQQPLQKLTLKTKNDQEISVHQCNYCGSHFLASGTANDLSLKQIREIDSLEHQQNPIATPHCPHCNLPLTPTNSSTSTIYTCPDNHGQFFPPQQLLQFKLDSIQKSPSKKTAKIALPLIGLILAVSILPLTLNKFSLSQDTRISADQILTQPLITPLTSNQVVISFSTTNDFITTLKLQTPTQLENYPLSTTPQTSHVITLNELQPQTQYTFTIEFRTSPNEKPNISPTYSFSTP